MWTTIAGFVLSGFKSWMTNRAERSQAKHERELRQINGEIELEKSTIENGMRGWKDEYLTVVFTSPLVMIFWAALTKDHEMMQQIFFAFEKMKEMPEEWWWTIGAITLGTFGLRGYREWKGNG